MPSPTNSGGRWISGKTSKKARKQDIEKIDHHIIGVTEAATALDKLKVHASRDAQSPRCAADPTVPHASLLAAASTPHSPKKRKAAGSVVWSDDLVQKEEKLKRNTGAQGDISLARGTVAGITSGVSGYMLGSLLEEFAHGLELNRDLLEVIKRTESHTSGGRRAHKKPTPLAGAALDGTENPDQRGKNDAVHDYDDEEEDSKELARSAYESAVDAACKLLRQQIDAAPHIRSSLPSAHDGDGDGENPYSSKQQLNNDLCGYDAVPYKADDAFQVFFQAYALQAISTFADRDDHDEEVSDDDNTDKYYQSFKEEEVKKSDNSNNSFKDDKNGTTAEFIADTDGKIIRDGSLASNNILGSTGHDHKIVDDSSNGACDGAMPSMQIGHATGAPSNSAARAAVAIHNAQLNPTFKSDGILEIERCASAMNIHSPRHSPPRNESDANNNDNGKPARSMMYAERNLSFLPDVDATSKGAGNTASVIGCMPATAAKSGSHRQHQEFEKKTICQDAELFDRLQICQHHQQHSQQQQFDEALQLSQSLVVHPHDGSVAVPAIAVPETVVPTRLEIQSYHRGRALSATSGELSARGTDMAPPKRQRKGSVKDEGLLPAVMTLHPDEEVDGPVAVHDTAGDVLQQNGPCQNQQSVEPIVVTEGEQPVHHRQPIGPAATVAEAAALSVGSERHMHHQPKEKSIKSNTSGKDNHIVSHNDVSGDENEPSSGALGGKSSHAQAGCGAGGGARAVGAAWGSSLVCADLTVNDVASSRWPLIQTAVPGQVSKHVLSDKDFAAIDKLVLALERCIDATLSQIYDNIDATRTANIPPGLKSVIAAAAFDEFFTKKHGSGSSGAGEERPKDN